jgi:hypothetical protein
MFLSRLEVQENEVGKACSTHGEETDAYGILMEIQKERDKWKDLDVGGRTI